VHLTLSLSKILKETIVDSIGKIILPDIIQVFKERQWMVEVRKLQKGADWDGGRVDEILILLPFEIVNRGEVEITVGPDESLLIGLKVNFDFEVKEAGWYYAMYVDTYGVEAICTGNETSMYLRKGDTLNWRNHHG